MGFDHENNDIKCDLAFCVWNVEAQCTHRGNIAPNTIDCPSYKRIQDFNRVGKFNQGAIYA